MEGGQFVDLHVGIHLTIRGGNKGKVRGGLDQGKRYNVVDISRG